MKTFYDAASFAARLVIIVEIKGAVIGLVLYKLGCFSDLKKAS